MKKLLAASLLAGACAWAQASTVSVNATVDLTTGFNGPNSINVFHDLGNSVLISEGDHVDLTIAFAPGQALRMTDIGFDGSAFTGWLLQDTNLSPPNTSDFTIGNVEYDLQGLQGTLSQPFSSDDQSTGLAHIGSQYWNLMQPGEQITFTGYHTSFDVLALQNHSSYYNATWTLFYASEVAIVAAPVPEPSTYALLAIGLAAIGTVAQRRRASR